MYTLLELQLAIDKGDDQRRGQENKPKTTEAKAKRKRRNNNKEANSTCTRATNSRGRSTCRPPHDLHSDARGTYKQSGQDAAQAHQPQSVELQPGRGTTGDTSAGSTRKTMSYQARSLEVCYPT